MTATQDNFDFKLVGERGNPFGGYVSNDDPTNTDPNVLVRGSQNVYKDLSRQIVNRCGIKKRGTGDATEDPIVTDFVWYDSTGRTLPVRVLESGKVQFESDILVDGTLVWYDLLTGLDKTRFIFSPWWDNDEAKDLLTMVNGSSNIYAWSGGVAVVASVGSLPAGVTSSGLVLNNGGTGIFVGMRFEITGGTGTGCIFEVTAENGSGVATAIRLLTNGTGYTTGLALTTTYVPVAGSGFGIPSLNPTVDISGIADYWSITKTGTTTWAEEGFLSSGIVTVNGVTYTYGLGTDTTTLTQVTTDTSAIPIGDIIYQTVTTTASTPGATFSNDFSIVTNNQLAIGSYSSRLVYVSSNTDYTDFTPAEFDTVGTPFILTLDDPVKGLAIRQGNLQISAGLSDWYEVILTQTSLASATDAFLVQIVNVNKRPGASLSSALGQEFITNVGDDIYYVAQDHQIYIYGSFTNQFTTRFPALSQSIRDELREEDLTGGCLRSINDSLYLISITSGKTYTYSARQNVDSNANIIAERLWYPPQIWNISRISVIDGVTYGASSQNPQYYQLFNTGQFHDDTPTETVAPYECIARWSYWHMDDRTKLSDLDKLYMEGYIAENSPLKARLRLNYLASTSFQEVDVSGLEDNPFLFTSGGLVPVGGGEIGGSTIGGSGLDEFGNPSLPKFRAIITWVRKNVFEYQFELYSFDEDSQWRILAIGTNASPVVNKPVFLQKS